MKDIKYLAAYSIPVVAFLSINLRGMFVYGTIIYAFGAIPLLEILLPIAEDNFSKQEVEKRSKQKLFDWLLYFNIPIVYGILIYGLYLLSFNTLETFEKIGIITSIGIVLGVNGINVGHELGHRQSSVERFLGKILLLPSLYMHFYIEHNIGHHLQAATKEDPATARYNQSVYSFWITSIFRQYLSAWRIQKRLLKSKNLGFLSFKNDMFWYIILQVFYLIGVFVGFGFNGVLYALISAVIGFLLLETVNYIEHYGLLRTKTKSGRYERVKEMHSWNSNHIIGRIVLYELTRHSDHHFKSSKKYQVLKCHESSPQMPYGYPTSMVIALIPPLWFKIMNKRIPCKMIPN